MNPLGHTTPAADSPSMISGSALRSIEANKDKALAERRNEKKEDVLAICVPTAKKWCDASNGNSDVVQMEVPAGLAFQRAASLASNANSSTKEFDKEEVERTTVDLGLPSIEGKKDVALVQAVGRPDEIVRLCLDMLRQTLNEGVPE